MRSRAVVAIALICAALGIVAFVREEQSSSFRPRTAAFKESVGPAAAAKPVLYCDFYNVTHNATVVSFYFEVDMVEQAAPRVRQLFLVEPDGTKTNFADDDVTQPRWSYRTMDEAPTITSPDSATTIVLYGFKPLRGGTFWFEAGLRSNDYRNLEGKCRQANFVPAATSIDSHT